MCSRFVHVYPNTCRTSLPAVVLPLTIRKGLVRQQRQWFLASMKCCRKLVLAPRYHHVVWDLSLQASCTYVHCRMIDGRPCSSGKSNTPSRKFGVYSRNFAIGVQCTECTCADTVTRSSVECSRQEPTSMRFFDMRRTP